MHETRALRRTWRARPMLDAGVPLVAVVFPVAAVSALDAREALDQLDHHAVLRHLVAELALDRWERSQLALGRDLVALAGMRVTRLPTAHSLDQVPQATCRRPFGVSTRGGFGRARFQRVITESGDGWGELDAGRQADAGGRPL